MMAAAMRAALCESAMPEFQHQPLCLQTKTLGFWSPRAGVYRGPSLSEWTGRRLAVRQGMQQRAGCQAPERLRRAQKVCPGRAARKHSNPYLYENLFHNLEGQIERWRARAIQAESLSRNNATGRVKRRASSTQCGS